MVEECAGMGIAPAEAQVVVMWGGGKDSTLALILACAVSCRIGCSVRAVTMTHPGLSQGTLANIQRVTEALNVEHEWRQFLQAGQPGAITNEQWIRLYQHLAPATQFHPRFMCIGCNFGSVVTEFEGLNDARAHFRITGNAQQELEEFERWAAALKGQLSDHISFPDITGRPLIDYFRIWWIIYSELLAELNALANQVESLNGMQLATDEYLYKFPSDTCVLAGTRVLSILEDGDMSYSSAEYRNLLEDFGWNLPEDIQGGTESDCMMPAAIAALDIQQHGLQTYMEHLNYTAQVLRPFPEMYDKAISWAQSGRSAREGEKLLRLMRLPPEGNKSGCTGTPVAMALVNQLLPVR
jgi:hypothetical protein